MFPSPALGRTPTVAGGRAIVFGETKWLDSTARSLNSRVGSTSRVVWGEPPRDEAEHFFQCPACGRWVDGCDLARPALTPSFGLEEFSRNRSNLVHVNRQRGLFFRVLEIFFYPPALDSHISQTLDFFLFRKSLRSAHLQPSMP